MNPLMAYAGNNLMNMVASKLHASQRNKFKGSGNSNGMAYAFDVIEAPVASLVHNTSTHNLRFDLKKVSISAQGNGLNVQQVLSIEATAKLAMVGGILSLTRLKVATPSTGLLDRLIVQLINTQVLPKIGAALQAIPVPQLTDVFGPGLSASLRTATVVSGPALEVGGRITGKTGLSAADAPTSANKALLNSGSASDARIIAMASGSAVNVLLKTTVAPISHAFNESGSKAGFGAGIKGTIKATVPELEIKNGKGKASTRITFSGLKGGIKIPIKGWTWVSLPSPVANLAVTHKLAAVGNKGVVELTGVDKLSVSLNWPTVLKPVQSVLVALLNGVLGLFKGMISKAVAGRKLEVFKLPTKVPGTSLGASLGFAPGGLAFHKNSVQAIVRIQS